MVDLSDGAAMAWLLALVAAAWEAYYILFYLFILFLAALGLRCGARASHCGGFSYGARPLERRLSRCGARGPVAPRHVGPSWTGARTRVPSIGRRILNHCATREVPWEASLNLLYTDGEGRGERGEGREGERERGRGREVCVWRESTSTGDF